jgi:hypothetical protein
MYLSLDHGHQNGTLMIVSLFSLARFCLIWSLALYLSNSQKKKYDFCIIFCFVFCFLFLSMKDIQKECQIWSRSSDIGPNSNELTQNNFYQIE